MGKEKSNMKFGKKQVRYLAMTAILAAVSAVLMMVSFSVPLVPSFLKMDISEMPALIATFSMGPVSGVLVCLIKNLINLPMTTTGGVGELANFLLGAVFVVPAGVIYHFVKNRKGALIAALSGCVAMSLISIPINYFLTYPVYATFMPIDTIIGMYQAILPSVDGLLSCLLIFNVPFTFVRGLLDAVLTFLVYKRISPLIKGSFK
jgi:riboflavin transporter FmnP